MSQRLEYWPAEHGYYYFRPYHMVHVKDQREIARSWGEDPRNPYDHKVFDRVYQALEAERAARSENAQFGGEIPAIDLSKRQENSKIRPAAFVLPPTARCRVRHSELSSPVPAR